MTVGKTQIEVGELVERVLARAGIKTFNQTPDAVYKARVNLFYFITALSNQGVYLWKIARKTIQLYAGQAYYTLPPGTIDLLNACRRDITTTADGTDVASATQITRTLTTPQRVTLAGVRVLGSSNGAENTLTIETFDGATWTTRATLIDTLTTDWYWFELDGVTAVTTQVRVTQTGTGNAALVAFNVVARYRDLALGKYNRDDWANTPDKTLQGQVNNYYFDKQADPAFYAWQVPQVDTLFWAQYQHQGTDVPELYETIEIPARWYDPLIDCVAYMVAKELTEVPPEKLKQLEDRADKAEIIGNDGENDGAPLRIMPSIRHYTR